MATAMITNRCSMCEKYAAKRVCTGCQNFFCAKHFNEHRQQLSIQFDHEVVRRHDELLEQINQENQSNDSSADLISQIDRWETTTIEKIQEAAKRVRQQLTELINDNKETMIKRLQTLTEEIRIPQNDDNFDEDDIRQLREKIDEIHRSLNEQIRMMNVVLNDEIDWNSLISIKKDEQKAQAPRLSTENTTKWIQTGITAAGGNGKGSEFNQLTAPYGLHIHDDQILYIADCANDRIVKWWCGAPSGQLVAGGNGKGNRCDQLSGPTDVIVDNQTDSLIICDNDNRRVVRWPREGGSIGQTIISGVKCWGLAMDDDRLLYVSDCEKHEVRRWRVGDSHGTVVAGGNGAGERLDQLNYPTFIFVDRDHSLYVSDSSNNRVMKWMKGAKEGIVVAGGQGNGNALQQLSNPAGLFVDRFGIVYVTDNENHRIMCWPKGASQGSIVVGGNGKGNQANQLSYPRGLSFDQYGNLYVVENSNYRVQMFSVDYRL